MRRSPTHLVASWSFVGLILLSAGCTDGPPTGPLDHAQPVSPAFDVISLPGDGYLTNTTKIVIDGLENCDPENPETFNVTSVSDGAMAVTFDRPLCKLTVPGSWGTWGSPPETEHSQPSVLFTGKPNNTLTLTLSKPAFVFGFEVEPNSFAAGGEFQVSARFFFATGAPTRTVSRRVSGWYGARLFGWSDEGITKVEIEVTSPNEIGFESLGFAIAQLRYRLTPLPLTPEQQVGRLIDQVTALGLGAGTTNSLMVKLDAVLAAITAGDIAGACTSLAAFTNEVRAHSGKRISDSDAALIMEKATQLVTELGCS